MAFWIRRYPTKGPPNSGTLLYWDRSIITDRYISDVLATIANTSDKVLMASINRVERRAVIIDMVIPYNDNLITAVKENKSKYLNHQTKTYLPTI